MARCLTQVITTLLAVFGALPMVGLAQQVKPYSFVIDPIVPSSLTTVDNAVIESGFASLTSDGLGSEFCKASVCSGRIYYSLIAKVPEGKAISFNTTFTFAMTQSRTGESTGDGLVFFLGAHPDALHGQSNGMFGLFSNNEEVAEKNIFFGIEFDTMKNIELEDEDGNHLGVDLNSALSAKVATADEVSVKLNDGQNITAWIDYAQNRVEARISYDTPGVLKPTEPLLTYTIDLNDLEITEFYAGFSSSSSLGFEQRHVIRSWQFSAMFDSLNQSRVRNRTLISIPVAAYATGAVVAVAVLLCCLVKCTACGKALHDQCMTAIIPSKIQEIMSKVTKTGNDQKPAGAAATTTGVGPNPVGGDLTDDDEENPKPVGKDDDETDEDDDETDDEEEDEDENPKPSKSISGAASDDDSEEDEEEDS